MSFELALDWWLLPLAITAGSFIWRWWMHMDEGPARGYGYIGRAIGGGGLLTLSVALVVSLTAWLVWAVLT